MRDELREVACIVVHHKHFPQILDTIAKIQACGVPAENIVVVDNSGSDSLTGTLRSTIPTPVTIVTIPNLGYANAVNAGVREIGRTQGLEIKYILVSTHETQPYETSVESLLSCMEIEDADVAGPTLTFDVIGRTHVWSTGGRLTRWLNKPKLYLYGTPLESLKPKSTAEDRHWLDGSFCLYRANVLLEHPLPETYFLYFEELDYHTTLRRSGLRIVWCPGAIVGQSPGSTPPYLIGRNLQLFQMRHGNVFQRTLSVPIVIAKNLVMSLLVPSRLSRTREIFLGWLAGTGLINDLPGIVPDQLRLKKRK